MGEGLIICGAAFIMASLTVLAYITGDRSVFRDPDSRTLVFWVFGFGLGVFLSPMSLLIIPRDWITESPLLLMAVMVGVPATWMYGVRKLLGRLASETD